MALNKFRISCKGCGFEAAASQNTRSVIPKGIYLGGKEYVWTGHHTKDEYCSKMKKLEKEGKTGKDAEHELKKEKALQKTREDNNIQTFRCPKCGKETLHWERLESKET